MTTPADLQGRSYDVLAFQGARPQGETLLVQDLADGPSGHGGGALCLGALRVAQRWLLCFLQTAGSVPYSRLQGTRFMNQLRSGRLRTETDVLQAFGIAQLAVARQLAAAESPTDLPDERFASATLTGLTVVPGFVTLSVNVLTAAGVSRPLLVPLPVVP